FPETTGDWSLLPRALDGFLSDHFGFRKELTAANAWLRYELASPTSELVMYGQDGYLFYTGQESVLQSTGILMRTENVKKFVQFVADLRDRLKKEGISLFVAMPPNASTVNRAHLPHWLNKTAIFTEYDLALQLLTECGVPAID